MLHGGKRGLFRQEILYAFRFATLLPAHAEALVHSSIYSAASGYCSERAPLHHTLLRGNGENLKSPLALNPTNCNADGLQRWKDPGREEDGSDVIRNFPSNSSTLTAPSDYGNSYDTDSLKRPMDGSKRGVVMIALKCRSG